MVKTHINQVAWDTQTKQRRRRKKNTQNNINLNISVVYSSRTNIAEKYSYRSSENHEKLQRFRFMLNEKCIKLELLAHSERGKVTLGGRVTG